MLQISALSYWVLQKGPLMVPKGSLDTNGYEQLNIEKNGLVYSLLFNSFLLNFTVLFTNGFFFRNVCNLVGGILRSPSFCSIPSIFIKPCWFSLL